MTDHAFGLRVVRPETSCPIPAAEREPWPAMDQELTIRVRREPGYVIVAVAGEIDIATVPRLRARLW